MLTVRPLETADLGQVLALNEQERPHVGGLDRAGLEALVAQAELALVATDAGAFAGFALVLGTGCDYDSPNYRFFARRGGRFLYVDRVAVTRSARRRGVASALYGVIEAHARDRGVMQVTCEVNLSPVNPPSLAFHLSRDFREVGRQDTMAGTVRVLLLAKRVIETQRTTDDGEGGDAQIPELELPEGGPCALVAAWMHEAASAGCRQPEAMTLATVDEHGRPDARVVLLRGVDAGFEFFTNYDSTKARHLASRAEVAGTLYFAELDRQVRLRGHAERLPDDASDRYFAARPRESQLAAWASQQSQAIADRAALEARMAQMTTRFAADEVVPRPAHWGGFRITVHTYEFWWSRRGRLHDRFRVTANGGQWVVQRLQP